MKLYTLNIKDRAFRVAVISDPKEMKEGLSGKPKLGKNKGLLFDFGKEKSITMNMVGMKYPLDMIFINMDREVVAVRSLKPGSYQTTVKDARFVLEVNKGMGVGLVGEKIECTAELAAAVGMVPCNKKKTEDDSRDHSPSNTNSLKIDKGVNIIVRVSTNPTRQEELFKKGGAFKIYEEDVKSKKESMQVLDDTGRVLMNINGGERIFSIEHTEQLVALSKKVDSGEASPEELGALMDKIIEKQNTQEPQYVED